MKNLILIFCLALFTSTSALAMDMAEHRPDFVLPDIDGNSRSVNEWDGKALIVNFWATWCIPCLREIPLFVKLQENLKEYDYQVLGLAVDSPESVKTFLEKYNINYPILVEETETQKVALSFSQDFLGLPFTVFTDHEGRIVWAQSAEIHEDETLVILEQVNKVKTGEIIVEQAKKEIETAITKIHKAR